MAFHFRPLSLYHKNEIEAVLQEYPPQISELTFTNLFIWRCYYQFQVAEVHGLYFLLASPSGANPFFSPLWE